MPHKLLAAVSITALLLTGCSAASSPAAAPEVTPIASSNAAPSTEASEPPEQERSDRGNLIKKVGQTAGLSNTNGEQSVNFMVTDINTKLKCNTDYPVKADNGHLIAVKMDVEVKKNFADPDYPGQTFPTDSSSWKFISTDGTTFNGSLTTDGSINCLENKQTLPFDGIGPSQKASGWIVLDVPSTTGTLIFSYFDGSGWEWDLKDTKANA